ncbi:zinc ribbon domain-containing protein [Actinacidiphila bryophytorum]|uniref:DUF35_N domain-containing protein n=1 Tax=Actinacidiphila bryophytorum TaxID=1436133 RepID=A0A9W4MH82_9ACTN|nr:zinc ribbon domain-containing protein [Actinacidiphila bryophytorum]MBM9440957.1 hypothetical protein [Actinacidiphila bryophytorum]MBN6542631.1 hypothetical protein [Actinacidiphila bryophytorum]CAG7647047.1 DUF35_N domain-containing protein [Actinacidiphila bryophytorum]
MIQSPSGSVSEARDSGVSYQLCRWCGTASFRRLLCPVCASSDLVPARGSGLGVVVRSGVVQRNTDAARNESVVRFPEGFVSRCTVVDAGPHPVEVGTAVRWLPDAEAAEGELLLELCDSGLPDAWT